MSSCEGMSSDGSLSSSACFEGCLQHERSTPGGSKQPKVGQIFIYSGPQSRKLFAKLFTSLSSAWNTEPDPSLRCHGISSTEVGNPTRSPSFFGTDPQEKARLKSSVTAGVTQRFCTGWWTFPSFQDEPLDLKKPLPHYNVNYASQHRSKRFDSPCWLRLCLDPRALWVAWTTRVQPAAFWAATPRPHRQIVALKV